MLSELSSAGEADIVAEAIESLIGDAERQGRLFARDLARITQRRDLAPDQLNAVIRELAQRGIRIEDDTPAPAPAASGGAGHELLSQQEESSLARTMQAGLRLRDELQRRSSELSGEMRQLIRNGEQARERLISCNRRLVHWVAADYRRSKVDVEDLVQEGMTGLMRAVEKFDPDLGIKFSTYAVWWIRQAITRTIDNTGDLIRIPVYRLEQLRRMRRISRQLTAEKGRAPTTMELAASLDWTLEFTAFMQELSRMGQVALDAPVTEYGETPWYELIADDRTPTPEQSALLDDLQRVVAEALEGLDAREQTIVKLRFGIGDDREHTLEEIGQKFGVTRERIRQIEEKALLRLVKAPAGKLLRAYRK
jgi:RNA polymerase primary sigma factor